MGFRDWLMKRQSKAEKQALNFINGKEKKKNHPEMLDLRWKGTVYGHVKDYKDQDYQAGGKKKKRIFPHKFLHVQELSPRTNGDTNSWEN